MVSQYNRSACAKEVVRALSSLAFSWLEQYAMTLRIH